MVRANLKNNFTEALNLILPKIRDVEILTDETDESYLSAHTDAGVQLPLHDLGGGVERLYQLYLDACTSCISIFSAPAAAHFLWMKWKTGCIIPFWKMSGPIRAYGCANGTCNW